MTGLSEQQLADMASALRRTEPATGEMVRRALSDARSICGHSHQPMVMERLRRAEAAVPAIVRRLLEAEARVAELEAERHSTNEALSDAAEAIRAKDQRITELDADNAATEARVREAVAQDFIRQGKASDSLNWGQAVDIARDGLCACNGGILPCDMGGAL